MEDLRLLFYGDSFVAGVGDPEGRGWVGRVVEAAYAASLPLTFYNLGVRHETSVEVARRFEREAEPRLAEGADCRVVVSFGANDASEVDGRLRADLDETVGALAAVLGAAADRGLRAFVVGAPPLGDERQVARIASTSARLGVVCRERGVPFVPVVEELLRSTTWFEETARFDGRHPAAGGYGELAQLVLAGGFLDWLRS